MAAIFASSSASIFFVLSICSTVNPLKKFSILQTGARYLSRVLSLAVHSFSIRLTTTLESVFRMQCRTPVAHNLRRPSSTASYSTILLPHLSVCTMNYSHAVYLNLMLEGDINIAAAPAPEIP
jgi:hypothetical protein